MRRAFARTRERVRRYTQSRREAERNFYGYSPQPTSRRTRTEPHQGSAIREEQRLERGAAFRTVGEQLYRRKRLVSVREMAPSVRHRGERRDEESLQVPLWRLQEAISQCPRRSETARRLRRLQRCPKRRRQAAGDAAWRKRPARTLWHRRQPRR